MTAACVFVCIGRICLIMAYRRRSSASPLTAVEARIWERRYANVSFLIAIFVGALNARGLLMDHTVNPLLIPMLATGLIFGYDAGVVTRLSVRPSICITSLLLATLPTLVGFCARIASAEGYYASSVFIVQTCLIASFMIASLEAVADIYRTTREHLIAKLDLAVLAGRDDLTGLPNRVQLRERFNEAGSRIGKSGHLLAVHCLDLDQFKAVNDTYGHPMGDALLQAVTKRLLMTVRAEDTVARMGGDEFVIVQSGIHETEEARKLALRIIQVVGTPYNLKGQDIRIGVSVGIAFAPRDGLNLERLISAPIAHFMRQSAAEGGASFFGANNQ
jgi:diguanylate cyclase (GGDEF)-like protein